MLRASELQFSSAMKHRKPHTIVIATAVAVGVAMSLVSLLSLLAITTVRATNYTQQKSGTNTPVLTAQQKQLVAAFARNVKDYLKQRQLVGRKVPKLLKDATPQQIDTYQKSFVEGLRVARAGTKPGYMFRPAMADYIRMIIRTEFKGSERAELRETILEADTKGVPLQVNYPYPETKELSQIPPTLLLKLPQLPTEVKYRFVGRHMLLVDTDNGLIVDYMLNALP